MASSILKLEVALLDLHSSVRYRECCAGASYKTAAQRSDMDSEPSPLLPDLLEEEIRRHVILPLLIASDMILRTKEPLSHPIMNTLLRI